MTAELNIQGIYVPALLVLGILAGLIGMAVQRLFMVLGVYRWVWHRSLFDFALMLIICWLLVSALFHGFFSFIFKPFL
jgi:H+/Cl- antiporter ClcA